METQRTNLNYKIKVTLTPLGVDIFYHKSDEINKHIAKRGWKQVERRMPQIDEDGYTFFQIWDFMEIYGSYVGMGRELPCETNILIEVENEES